METVQAFVRGVVEFCRDTWRQIMRDLGWGFIILMLLVPIFACGVSYLLVSNMFPGF